LQSRRVDYIGFLHAFKSFHMNRQEPIAKLPLGTVLGPGTKRGNNYDEEKCSTTSHARNCTTAARQ